jgi:hypothetical protein
MEVDKEESQLLGNVELSGPDLYDTLGRQHGKLLSFIMKQIRLNRFSRQRFH